MKVGFAIAGSPGHYFLGEQVNFSKNAE